MGGLEATRAIRTFEAEHQLRPCVIIAMHPRMPPEQEQKQLKVGFDAVLHKPLHVRSFLPMLFGDEKHNILHQRGSLTEEEARSLSLGPWPPYLEPAQRPSSTRRKQARLQQLWQATLEYPGHREGVLYHHFLYTYASRNLDLKRLLAEKAKDFNKKSEDFIIARAALKAIREEFRDTNLEYKRTLGFGGFGIAAKYAQRDRSGRHLRHVVVKAPLKPDSSVVAKSHRREHEWYKVHDDPLPGSDEPGESWQYIFNWDAKDYYIITEFLEHGELVTLIERLNETAQDQLRDDLSPKLTFVPNRLLWRIFLCLLRGVIAMAWPSAAEDWRKEVLDQDETITDEAIDAMLEETPIREFVGFSGDQQDIAHFDIDVYNIFLGQGKDPNDEEHKFIRAVFEPGTDREELKRQERTGKHRWKAPEQFLGMLPDQNTWNYKTNLWGIGATMCALMAKASLPGDADKKTCEDATFTYPSGEKIVVPETFAHFLGDDPEPTPSGSYVKWPMFARFDVDLRYTVAALMSRSLDIRGTLDLLYLTITGQIEEGDQQARKRQVPAWETDAALKKFVDDHLRNAPEKEFVAEQALLEPTQPRFGDRVAAAGIQFGELRFGALNFGGP
ncbi:hypothetical protein PG996_005439 [Apiospora saccharicola]|uniref:Response regulatory domain-containing protein n=1 Tax=Apiospora saccharicola TaxID=335842 RepID=A0ABR1VLH4_9PEZI